MKRISVQFKILLTAIGSMVAVAAIAAGVGIVFLRQEAESNAKTKMNLAVNTNGDMLNQLLIQTEDTTHAFQCMAVDNISSVEELKVSANARDSYLTRLQKNFDSIAGREKEAGARTPGAVGYYFAFNPEISGVNKEQEQGEGFFFVRDVESETYTNHAVVNILKYDKSEKGHVSWWYESTSEEKNPKRQAVWLSPYKNENVRRELISYIAPIWFYDDNAKEDVLIGVAGMDVDFSYIRGIVSSISIYGSGYAFLENSQGQILYHKDVRPNFDDDSSAALKVDVTSGKRYLDQEASDGELVSYKHDGASKSLAFMTLRNSMRLCLTANDWDIYASLRRSVTITSVATIALVALCATLSTLIVKRLVRPIMEINDAAKKIAQGNLDVRIERNSKDEIGELVNSFNIMSDHLERNIRRIQEIAYQDSLTSVRNKTAYDKEVESLNDQISKGEAEFALVMVDINELKYTNDHFGHETGNQVISLTARTISRIFSQSPIYRVGGDEFVIIAQNDDYLDLTTRLGAMDAITKLPNHRRKDSTATTVSVSYGYAVCKHGDTKAYLDIFREADSNMYFNKKRIKRRKGAAIA